MGGTEAMGYFAEYVHGTRAALDGAVALAQRIEEATERILQALTDNGTIYFAGNGGSASDAQHLAAELMGKFALDRAPLRSVCLNTDTSVMTAVANDFGYEQVFTRQIRALAGPKDVVVLISTSGESPSIVAACAVAHEVGATVVALTGSGASSLATSADLAIAVGTHPTCHIQEAHITIGQAICGEIERRLFSATT